MVHPIWSEKRWRTKPKQKTCHCPILWGHCMYRIYRSYFSWLSWECVIRTVILVWFQKVNLHYVKGNDMVIVTPSNMKNRIIGQKLNDLSPSTCIVHSEVKGQLIERHQKSKTRERERHCSCNKHRLKTSTLPEIWQLALIQHFFLIKDSSSPTWWLMLH